MAFDAGMVMAVAHELKNELLSSKVEKVLQPEKDEIILLLHKGRETKRLLLSASASSPRIHVTKIIKENPLKAPMLCMLLRKHLTGAKLTDIIQPGFERVLKLEFAATDEMGFSGKKYLIIEIMGKYSNIILCDEKERILGACKTVDFTTSQKRQVLPGMQYELPPAQNKLNPLELNKIQFTELCEEFGISDRETERADKFITAHYLGISSLLAREIVYTANENRVSIYSCFENIIRSLRSNNFIPTLIRDNEGRPSEYCFTDIKQFGNSAKSEHPETFSALLESFFEERDRAERRRQREADLLRTLGSTQARLERKLAAQQSELQACSDGQRFKHYGDLITANIWAVPRGAKEAELTDYCSESLEKIAVPLDSRLTPSQNAQKYYKKYNKLKNAERELAVQIKTAENELKYIETVFDALSRCESESDIDEIRAELAESGFSPKLKKSAKTQKKPSGNISAIEYRTTGGCCVLCGRNNIQNDILTTRTADKNDWWFHVKNIPGSHVILFPIGDDEPSPEDFTEAAVIAAVNSKASKGENTAVDYTQIKYIKKPAGAKPGFVTYTKNWTAYVTPNAEAAEKLKISK